MSAANQKRRVSPVRAVRCLMGPTVRRIVTLGGVAAAGWLLAGAAPAMADGVQFDAPAVVSSVTEDGPQGHPGADGASGEAFGGDSGAAPAAPEPAAEAPAAQSGAAEAEGSLRRTLDTERTASSLSSVTTETGAAALSTVGSAARGAGAAVSETTEAGGDLGHRAERSLSESTLTEDVAEGLSKSSDDLGRGLGIERGHGRGTPVLDDIAGIVRGPKGSDRDSGAEHHDRGTDQGPDRAGERDRERATAPERTTRADAPERAEAKPSPIADLDHFFALPHEHTSAVADDARGDRAGADGIDRHDWTKGSESTGTVSAASAPVMAAAAGFLTHRADSRKPLALGVALPGDPTLVVRDAADDPSFSPD